ncbi:MAG: glycosyltransferase family 2 protein [Bacteroidia bacterium]|nr:glycosyltransferase family 2 protein [Bacteroidia bacterium]
MQTNVMKKICAITMARNDAFFLRHWIEYYGSQLGKENLYIFLDGTDQPVPENAGAATVTHCERIPGQVVSAEKRRLAHLSNTAAELLKKYDLVIGTDADEFLVVDPDCNETLQSYLSKLKIETSVSGLGLDVGQNMNKEKTIHEEQSFLSQRSYAILSPRYTKPVVLAKPVTWGSGFHRIKGHNFRIDKNLYLFHFGVFDMKMVEDRFLDKDRMAAGWERHMKKRTKVITRVTEKKPLKGDRFLSLARTIQTFCRPIYAWNKPIMLGMKWVMKIPERFKKIEI